MTTGGSGEPVTARGRATRARIVQAAAELMYTRSVAATTLDDVRAASGTSKSQLYHYFTDKDVLVHAVVQYQGVRVLERNTQRLARLESIRGLELWCEAVVQRNAVRDGAYGCELGSLASELADVDEDSRVALADLFTRWEQLLADGFARMRDSGLLWADASPRTLATAVIAALQGGYLLAQTAHDPGPMRIALNMALGYVRTFEVTR